MAFKDLMNKAQDLAGSATAAGEKVITELNEALPVLASLGLTVQDLRVGMGLLPEVGGKLAGSIDAIDEDELKRCIEKYQDKKVLEALLKGLLAAYQIKDQLGNLGLAGVEMDFTLGIPPKVAVQFVKSDPRGLSAAAGD